MNFKSSLAPQDGGNVDDNQRYHLLLTYDADAPDGYEMKLHLNGQLVGETGDFGNSIQTTENSSWLLG